jgi:hypothetical protein
MVVCLVYGMLFTVNGGVMYMVLCTAKQCVCSGSGRSFVVVCCGFAGGF